jgi:pimeloyl-ACP methyl ester carboxylesterase
MGLTFTERRRRISLLGWPSDVISIDPKPDDDSCPDYHLNGNHCRRDPRPSPVHTVIFWVPGNPGQHDWYNSDFMDVLSGLGQGYAVRSVSHAGHGFLGKSNRDHDGSNDNFITDVEDCCRFRGKNHGTDSVSPLIPWTVEGQVLHKIAYVDSLLSSIAEENRQRQIQTKNHQKHQGQRSCEFIPDLKFILIGHSFGCHVIQRMCVLRPDILERISGLLFLMPYLRTKPSFATDQRMLDFGASRSELLIALSTKITQALWFFPHSTFQSVIRKGLQSASSDSGDNDGGGVEDEIIANVIVKLLRNPIYPRNFFELGTEEIRDVPNEIDIAALRLLSSHRSSLSQNTTKDSDCQLERPRKQQQQHRPIFILYAGDNDQWSPAFHGEEIKAFQSANLLPPSIKTTKIPGLRHDYVCQSRLVRSKVNDWIISNILEMENGIAPRTNAADSSSESQNMPRPTPTMLPSKL